MIFRLVDHGTVFSTRPKGASVRKILLASKSVDGTVEVSFEGVQSVSSSFADEFLGPLVLGSDEVRLTGVSPPVRRIVERTLRRRGLRPSQVARIATPA